MRLVADFSRGLKEEVIKYLYNGSVLLRCIDPKASTIPQGEFELCL